MASFEVLLGLPPYGPMAKPFPASGYGAFRQGFVVQFESEKIGTWVGNFQSGLTTFSGAYDHPDGKLVVIVAGGAIYIVDPDTQAAEESGGMVSSVIQVSEKNALLFNDNIYLSLISSHGNWQTKRLSWDGIRNLSISGDFVLGEGWRYDDTWHEFSVSLANGSHSGGAYDGSEFVPIRRPWWQFWRGHA
jgi:hypothetical protein